MRSGLNMARVGGILMIAGVALTAILTAMAASGQPVGLGGPSVNQWAVIACLALLGGGAAAIGLGGAAPFDARATRSGLGIFAVGSLSLAASGIVAARLVSGEADPLGDLPTMVLGLGGLLVPIGVIVTGASLLRSTGLARVAGACLLAGPLIAIGTLAASIPIGVALGWLLAGVGLMGVAWLAVRVS